MYCVYTDKSLLKYLPAITDQLVHIDACSDTQCIGKYLCV